MKQNYLILVLVSFLVGGCAAPQPAREKVMVIGPTEEETKVEAVQELKAYLRQGLTTEEVRAWLAPARVNETVGSFGRHEQWCYLFFNLYFKNGRLDSWQIFL